MKAEWIMNWKAIGTGLAIGAIVAFVGEGSGFGEMIFPENAAYVLAGLLGGMVAGYLRGDSMRAGAYAGGTVGIIGGIVTLLATSVVYAGVGAWAIPIAGLVFVIPGIVGGALIGLLALPVPFYLAKAVVIPFAGNPFGQQLSSVTWMQALSYVFLVLVTPLAIGAIAIVVTRGGTILVGATTGYLFARR